MDRTRHSMQVRPFRMSLVRQSAACCKVWSVMKHPVSFMRVK